MTFKKLIGKLHLWLGLSSGLVVFIVSVTGCIYAFQIEIQNLTQSFRFVEPENKEYLLPSQIKEIAEKELPGKKIHSVHYKKREEAAVVTFFSFDPKYYYLIYVNPYNGKVLKVKDMDYDFFRIVLMGHFYLWLPDEAGQTIVASATLIFLVMLISGLILWWPKNKSAAKQRFSIKWNARWRRKNYDLHNVLGFYMTWVVIFISLTGLVWGFKWFEQGVYYAISGGEKFQEYSEPASGTTQLYISSEKPAVDKIWLKVKDVYAKADGIEMHFPESPEGSILAAVNPDVNTLWKIDYIFFDQYTLRELSVDHVWGRFKEATVAQKVMRMNYDIHVGGILGFPGKMLAFFASLIASSLPITGFYIWWGRRNKEKKTGNPILFKKGLKEKVVQEIEL